MIIGPGALSPLRILFVDDEPSILSSLRRLLSDEPFEVLTAESGKAALQLLNNDKSVAVIVSDQRMPEMTGAEFLVKTRAIVPDAVRIVLTGYADIQTAIDAINKGGAYRYIAKPWNDDEMVAVIREAASRYALEQENRRLTEIVHRQNAELKQWSAQLEYDVQRKTIEIRNKNEELNAFNERLKKNFHDSIRAFVGLIELRDQRSIGHSRNVAEIAARTAGDLALPIEEIETITMAALLHDIGKLGMPDVMLAKSYEVLTPKERREYMLHPVRGQAAIDTIEDLRHAGTMVRGHHEAFDGTGFPDRLKGENIPIGARIIAAADLFDRTLALHRKENAFDAAWRRLKKEEGKRLDPAICRVVEKHLGSVYAKKTPKTGMTRVTLSIDDLKEGMVLGKDVTSGTGLLLLSEGMTIVEKNIQALKRYNQLDPFRRGIYVWAKRRQ